MNSQNHVMLLGDLLIWYYENIAGIKSNPETPGFKQIIMKPDFETGLSFINSSYESIYGTIISNWKKTKSNLQWNITIPANSSAIVYLPITNASNVVLNNKKLDKTDSVFKIENNKIVLTLPSGTYILLVLFSPCNKPFLVIISSHI